MTDLILAPLPQSLLEIRAGVGDSLVRLCSVQVFRGGKHWTTVDNKTPCRVDNRTGAFALGLGQEHALVRDCSEDWDPPAYLVRRPEVKPQQSYQSWLNGLRPDQLSPDQGESVTLPLSFPQGTFDIRPHSGGKR